MRLAPPPFHRPRLVPTDPAMPKLPPPPHRPPPERPLFDTVTDWAAREENKPMALALGIGTFAGSIFWLLWALQ